MATTTLVYVDIADLQEWGWDYMEQAEIVHDSDEFDYVDMDFYPTGIRIDFANAPKDGRFELGDIEDIYSYPQRGGYGHTFLQEVVNAESVEAFKELLIGHCTDFSDPDS